MGNIDKDFKLFAKDKMNLSSLLIDDFTKKTQNILYPSIVEERTSSRNAIEMNVFSRLIQERIIFLSGEVIPDMIDVIVAQLLYLDSVDNRDINLYINSGGGDCYSGLELISVMDFINSNVSTTVLGLAASMAAVIASNGEKGKRFILPYSRFMIHQPSSSMGRATFTDTKIHLEEMESVRNDLYEVLVRNSGNDIKTIIDLCENGDKWLKSDDAIKLGFVDKKIEKKES